MSSSLIALHVALIAAVGSVFVLGFIAGWSGRDWFAQRDFWHVQRAYRLAAQRLPQQRTAESIYAAGHYPAVSGGVVEERLRQRDLVLFPQRLKTQVVARREEGERA